MLRNELLMCIKCLKSAIDYPNENSLKFVLSYLEQDLEGSKRRGKCQKGTHKVTEENKRKMQKGRNIIYKSKLQTSTSQEKEGK